MNTKTILTIICIMAGVALQAQEDFAVISDKDGYTNVREGGVKSKIIGEISKYQPFECMDSEDVNAEQIENMLFISFAKYVEKSGFLQNNENTSKDGYIHKSRVQRLADLQQLKKTPDTHNKAVFRNDTMNVTFEFAPFDYKKHVLKDFEGKTIPQSAVLRANTSFVGLETIDNEKVWGTDGSIPRKEIKSITITCKNKTLSLPANGLKNIFEPNAESTQICIGTDGEIYIRMLNGDSAGAYNVIWVIVGGELKYRYVQSSFYV